MHFVKTLLYITCKGLQDVHKKSWIPSKEKLSAVRASTNIEISSCLFSFFFLFSIVRRTCPIRWAWRRRWTSGSTRRRRRRTCGRAGRTEGRRWRSGRCAPGGRPRRSRDNGSRPAGGTRTRRLDTGRTGSDGCSSPRSGSNRATARGPHRCRGNKHK